MAAIAELLMCFDGNSDNYAVGKTSETLKDDVLHKRRYY